MNNRTIEQFNQEIEETLNKYVNKLSIEEMIGSLTIWQNALQDSEKDDKDEDY